RARRRAVGRGRDARAGGWRTARSASCGATTGSGNSPGRRRRSAPQATRGPASKGKRGTASGSGCLPASELLFSQGVPGQRGIERMDWTGGRRAFRIAVRAPKWSEQPAMSNPAVLDTIASYLPALIVRRLVADPTSLPLPTAEEGPAA